MGGSLTRAQYTPDAEIAVTPCKHMYHKDCLDVSASASALAALLLMPTLTRQLWFQQPNCTTTTCPMCRRDLAMLAIMPEFVKSRGEDEATEAWLAVQ
jgi:hypothetical protein